MILANRVLLIGSDENLLKLRGKVLQAARLDVIEATSCQQVKEALETDSVRVAVLCHTLRDGRLAETLDQLEACRGQVKTVLMARSMRAGDERAVEMADEVVTPISGPAQLIATVKKLMG